jgi:hypothetical protein
MMPLTLSGRDAAVEVEDARRNNRAVRSAGGIGGFSLFQSAHSRP